MKKTLTLLQFTDTHVYSDPSRRMKGVDTYKTLTDVLDAAVREEPHANMVVLTGDISQDETAGSYDRLAEAFERFSIPIYFIPGNHDGHLALAQRLDDRPNFTRGSHCVIDDWLLVFLDSTIEGKVEGALSIAELARLDSVLAEFGSGKKAVIFLHHNPVNLHPPRPDKIMLQNADEFFEVVDRNGNVGAVVWGHVHEEFNSERNGVRLFASPSTCVQFRPTATGITIAEAPPGYRTIRLCEDGTIESHVSRLDAIPEGLIITGEDLG